MQPAALLPPHLVVPSVEVQCCQAQLVLQGVPQAAVQCHECILIATLVCTVELDARGQGAARALQDKDRIRGCG